MILFPFTSFQQFNLDWIMQQLKKILDFMPLNGVPGDVLQRNVDGAAWMPISAVSMDIHGLNTIPDVDPADELPIYDNDQQGNYKVSVSDLMDAAPVQSVNGQTGDVVLSIPLVPVDSVNGQTGTVVLDASDVGALPDTYTAPVTSVNGQTGDVVLSIPSVYSVNNQVGSVVLDAADVGALPDTYVAPVTSVNGQTGDVIVSGSANLLFGQLEPLSISAPTGVTAYSNLIAQKSSDGKAFRLTGALSVMKGSDSGSKVFTVSGLTITPPTTEVNVYYCGLKMDGESAFTINYTNIYDCPSVKVATDGTITITAQQDYGSVNQFTFYWFPSVIITLA